MARNSQDGDSDGKGNYRNDEIDDDYEVDRPLNHFGENENKGKGCAKTSNNAPKAEIKKILDTATDQQMALACIGEQVDDSKIESIAGQCLAGRVLSDKQKYCLASYMVSRGLKIT